MTVDEQMKIEEAVWEASTHIDTAYGLMVAFWEDYISHTNDTSLAYDMEHRRYIAADKKRNIIAELQQPKAS